MYVMKLNSHIFSGYNCEKVIDIITKRKQKDKSVDRKLGIAVEGGSIRGVISAAILHALNYFDIEKYIDVSFGTSSGALNSLYFLSKDMDVARSIYSENAITKDCLNILSYPNIMNVKWLVDNWISDKKKFDENKVRNSPVELFVTATNTRKCCVRYFSSKYDIWENFVKAYGASCMQPIASTNTELIDGDIYIDGYVYAAIPIQHAIKAGCTDLIIVRSQLKNYQKEKAGLLMNMFEKYRLNGYSKTFRKDFSNRYLRYNKSLKEIGTGFDGKINTLAIHPTESLLISSMETSEKVVNDAFYSVYKLIKDELRRKLSNGLHQCS
jgi:predicted patatin/cPLA2 family phospholipase